MTTDVEFLGLEATGEPGRHRFTVTERLARLDGRLYGGTAIAVSIATAELATERTPLWVTTQFVSTVGTGSDVDVLTEVLAQGGRTSQVRVTATSASGDTVFASLGATGRPKHEGLTGVFERQPVVDGPAGSELWSNPMVGVARALGIEPPPALVAQGSDGFGLSMEIRQPTVHDHPDPGPGRLCIWVRRRDGVPVTPAIAAYLADMVPMSIVSALKVPAAGTSLDNTMRLGSFVETEWILLDLRPHLAIGGYAHGIAHVWSEDGHLLATASQTASMSQIDPSLLPGVAEAAG
jgi:acyl-CoA thioesterase-2